LEAFTAHKAAQVESVRIIVLSSGHVGSLALTLESVFAARIGLSDSVVAIVDEGDVEAAAYLTLCEGLDDAFLWRESTLGQYIQSALQDGDEGFVAFLQAGTVVTQGWLARLIRSVEGNCEVGAIGPMLTSGPGAQNGTALLKGNGSFHPNDISQGFARAFPGQVEQVQRLNQACLLMRRTDALLAIAAGAADLHQLQAWISGQGMCLLAAKDVFVHVDNRTGALARAA
jgi:hypothetical protein